MKAKLKSKNEDYPKTIEIVLETKAEMCDLFHRVNAPADSINGIILEEYKDEPKANTGDSFPLYRVLKQIIEY